MPVAAIGSAVIGAGASIYGSTQQANAEKSAIAAQQGMFNTGLGVAQGALNPFITAGQGALQNYNAALPDLTAKFDPSSLPSTPGYQFTLNQGLQSTQNSFAAQGLGSSGAALKGAAAYTTGLAQNTYNQQFQNYLSQQQQRANLLYQPVGAGVSAASALGGAAMGGAVSTGQGIASSTAGLGNALAGGATGVANSVSGGLNNAALYSYLQDGNNGGLMNSLSGPAYGGGNFMTDAYGGSAQNPLVGLTAADYG